MAGAAHSTASLTGFSLIRPWQGKLQSRSCALIFFFQAEDGIRDHCVTGVQTCALPICLRAGPFTGCGSGFAETKSTGAGETGFVHAGNQDWIGPVARNAAEGASVGRDYRSEERRVGKECRARVWRDE